MAGCAVRIVRVDGTAKPAYFALRDLIKGEWWMGRTTVVTDDAGRFVIDGVAGRCVVSAGGTSVTINATSPGLGEAPVLLS